MSEAKLYLRRRGRGTEGRLTGGKLYEVVGHYSPGFPTVINDIGDKWHAFDTSLWQEVWILPDGTELEALE